MKQPGWAEQEATGLSPLHCSQTPSAELSQGSEKHSRTLHPYKTKQPHSNHDGQRPEGEALVLSRWLRTKTKVICQSLWITWDLGQIVQNLNVGEIYNYFG